MIYFKTHYETYGSPSIVPIEVERESESSIWFNGRMIRKDTNYYRHFKTHQEAKEYLQRMVDKDIEQVQATLQRRIQMKAKIDQL